MKRIMLYILAFLAYGIIVARYAYEIWYIIALMTASVFVCVGLYIKYKRKIAFLYAFFTFLGFCLTLNCGVLIKKEIKWAENKKSEVTVEAYVKEKRKTQENKAYYVLKTDNFVIDNEKILNKINLIYYPKENEELLNSQRVVIKGKLNLIKENSNPYAFNAYNYYSARKIYYSMNGRAEEKGEVIHNLNFYLSMIRDKIGNVYDEILPQRYSAIAKAIILGDKYELNDDLEDNFKLCGIYHILAISGLHISIISGLLVFLFDKISVRFGKIGVILALILYAMLTGGSPSVVRATIMTTVVLFRYVIKRGSDFLISIAFSCVLLLCYSPMLLFDIGFQYSYTAVFTICLIVKPIIEIYEREKGRNYIITLLISCVIISIALKPITAYYFYYASNVDFILNIIILPIISIGVIMALISGIVGLFSLSLAKFCIGIFYVIFRFIDILSEALLKIHFSFVLTGRTSLIIMLGFYGFVILTGVWLYKGRQKARERLYIFLIGLVIFTISTAIDLGIRNSHNLEVTFLDVGQGDSIYGEYEKFNFLIDGGGNYLKENGSDTGERVLLPHLMGKGKNRINAIFISHCDADHIKGVIEIMDKVLIDNIYVSYEERESEYYKEMLKKAKENNIRVSKMKKGDFIGYKKFNIKCVFPYEEVEKDSNNSSLVLKAELGNRSFLFTGDIEKESENLILGEDIACDVLKVAHHGSDTSTTEEFLAGTKSSVAVISVGENNIYNHPSKAVVKRIEEKEIKLYNTSKDGAVTIITDGEKMWLGKRGAEVE